MFGMTVGEVVVFGFASQIIDFLGFGSKLQSLIFQKKLLLVTFKTIGNKRTFATAHIFIFLVLSVDDSFNACVCWENMGVYIHTV